MMKVLVTGGFGFLGMATVRRLSGLGHDVRILDSRNPPQGWLPHTRKPVVKRNSRCLKATCPEMPDTPVDVVIGDMRDAETCRIACNGMDAVMHFAGISSIGFSVRRPLDAIDINVRGTRTLFDGAERAGVRRIVYASSAKVYGFTEKSPFHEDDAPSPQTPYALTKIISEQYCRLLFERSGVESASLRLFSVYGPGQSLCNGYIGPLIAASASGRPAMIKGDASLRRDFTYVDDAVTAAVKALTVPGIGCEVLNVGTGTTTSLAEVIDILADISGSRMDVNYIPLLQGMTHSTHADMTRSRIVLGFSPETVLEEGLRNTFGWYVRLQDTLRVVAKEKNKQGRRRCEVHT